MKYLLVLMFVISLVSCRSGEARKFYTLLDSTEKKVFRILVADSAEKQRLIALVDKQPETASALAKQQVAELSRVINELERVNVNHIKDATPLKLNTVNSYKGMLQLKEADVIEAQLLALTLKDDVKQKEKATSGTVDLIRKRLKIHKFISESDSLKYNAKLKFEETNRIY